MAASKRRAEVARVRWAAHVRWDSCSDVRRVTRESIVLSPLRQLLCRDSVWSVVGYLGGGIGYPVRFIGHEADY